MAYHSEIHANRNGRVFYFRGFALLPYGSLENVQRGKHVEQGSTASGPSKQTDQLG